MSSGFQPMDLSAPSMSLSAWQEDGAKKEIVLGEQGICGGQREHQCGDAEQPCNFPM